LKTLVDLYDIFSSNISSIENMSFSKSKIDQLI